MKRFMAVCMLLLAHRVFAETVVWETGWFRGLLLSNNCVGFQIKAISRIDSQYFNFHIDAFFEYKGSVVTTERIYTLKKGDIFNFYDPIFISNEDSPPPLKLKVLDIENNKITLEMQE